MDPVSTNIQAGRGTFVGRRTELKSLGDAVRSGVRLVTITGDAGVGKTRLARRYGRAHLAAYRDAGGVWFCDLTEATTESGLTSVVGNVLNVPLTSGRDAHDLVSQLGRALGGRGPVLLVLDGADHVSEPLRRALRMWLEDAPEARFVVTAPYPLGAEVEHVVKLEPFGAEEAATLFVARAKAVRRSFAGEDTDDRAVLAIALRTEGVPLAIELAAAQVRRLSARQLSERLARRPLRVGPAAASVVDRLIESAYGLLQPWEREALDQCAVFVGGFRPRDAEAVLDLSAFADAPPVGRVLDGLLETWFLQAWDEPQLPTRLGMHPAVRAFASGKLGLHGKRVALEARHAAWFLHYAHELVEGLAAPGGERNYDLLLVEVDNLFAVHRRMASRDPDASARAALCLHPVLRARGPFDAHLEALVAAAERVGTDDVTLRMQVFKEAGTALRLRGRIEEAKHHLGAALALAQEHGHRALEGVLLADLGNLHLARGDVERADETFHRALDVYRDGGDALAEGVVLGALGDVRVAQGRYDEARALYEQALVMHRQSGNRRDEAAVLGVLGLAAVDEGRCEDAERLLGAALELHRWFGDRRLQGVFLDLLAGVYLEEGRIDLAAENANAALFALGEGDSPAEESQALTHLGVVHALRDELGEAWATLQQAFQLARLANDLRQCGLIRIYVGIVAALGGAADDADAELDRASDDLGMGPVEEAAVEIGRGVVELIRARDAATAGDAPLYARHRRNAALRVEAANEGREPPRARSQDVRVLLRLWAHARHEGGVLDD